jgi:hypothetical protein
MTVMAAQPPSERPFSVVEKPEEAAAASAETMGCVLTAAVWRSWRTGVEVHTARRAERVKVCENLMVAAY